MSRVAQEIPKIGLVMEQVRIAQWLKQPGDAVRQGEPICEVESEKSVVEIEAEASGILAEIVMDVGADASVGDLIAWIESDSAPAQVEAQDASRDEPTQESTPAVEPTPTREPATRPVTMPAGERIPSSPVARRLAREHGIDLTTVSGSGPRGRIQLADVEAVIAATSAAPAATPVRSGISSNQAQSLSPMRRALARAMHLSNATVPQFVVERSVDWTTLETLRAALNSTRAAGSPKLSVNDFLLKAVATALIEFPRMNAIFEGDANGPDARIVPVDGAHIGLVVAVDDGLVVPVLNRVNNKGLAAIAADREERVTRGLAGKLRPDEMSGATFSISNLGLNGPDRFTAIINPPQSAILAVGRPMETVIARDGAIMIRPTSALCLTVDHRLIDGRLASDFLARVVEILQANHWQT